MVQLQKNSFRALLHITFSNKVENQLNCVHCYLLLNYAYVFEDASSHLVFTTQEKQQKTIQHSVLPLQLLWIPKFFLHNDKILCRNFPVWYITCKKWKHSNV